MKDLFPATHRGWWVFLTVLVLGLTIAMTGLTYCKETNVYWREISGWRAEAHWLAMHTYYPLWNLNLLLLVILYWRSRARGRLGSVLLLALTVFGINFFMLSANNVINIIVGRPLHSSHRGIGW